MALQLRTHNITYSILTEYDIIVNKIMHAVKQMQYIEMISKIDEVPSAFINSIKPNSIAVNAASLP